jgi:hypothetical protein
MVKKSLVILFLIGGLFLAACSPISNSARDLTQVIASTQVAKGIAPEVAYPAQSESYNSLATGSGSNTSADAQRLVITNASISIIVDDPARTVDFITNLAIGMQGFVVSSNVYQTTSSDGTTYPAANITIRVPAASMDNALSQIKGQVKDPATDIRSEQVTGQDVTKEYTDLQSQLTNLEQAEKQLQNIMDSATKVDDVLNVFNQLTSIQSQIQVLKGQIKYYQEASALSAISVDITAASSIAPLTIGGWQPAGVARDAIQTMINALQVLANIAIWIVLFLLPVLIVIGLPIFLVVFFFIRWRKARQRRQHLPEVTPPAA